MYNEVLNLIRVGIELLHQFLKEKRGAALKGQDWNKPRRKLYF